MVEEEAQGNHDQAGKAGNNAVNTETEVGNAAHQYADDRADQAEGNVLFLRSSGHSVGVVVGGALRLGSHVVDGHVGVVAHLRLLGRGVGRLSRSGSSLLLHVSFICRLGCCGSRG